MNYLTTFYLDKEKDMPVSLFTSRGKMTFVLATPHHKSGCLIVNLARLTGSAVSEDGRGRKIIIGKVDGYVDGEGNDVYILRFNNTKIAAVYPSGNVEAEASVPAIAKTLMSQTKKSALPFAKTVVSTFIPRDDKFHTDLHTHMNANLTPDHLIALGIARQLAYPLYYIRKLHLSLTRAQQKKIVRARRKTAEQFAQSGLKGKYLTRKIDDNTVINFADLILNNPSCAAGNIAKIRSSLAIAKDGQAVFADLEKVYLYRYVFTRGQEAKTRISLKNLDKIPDPDIADTVRQMLDDHRRGSPYERNTLFQDKLLWIARQYRKQGVCYAEIADTALADKDKAPRALSQIHEIMPVITARTGVSLRFLAGLRRIPLTIVKDNVTAGSYLSENLRVLSAVADDPYIAGADIIGEEINDIRELAPVISAMVGIAVKVPGFTIRLHAGENDALKDNVENALLCVKNSISGQTKTPPVRIGHGLHIPDLSSEKGRRLIKLIRETGAVLEFQITSNVRLNNLTSVQRHPLKQYLALGVKCVQGTDGGGIYGTDVIDEQLALTQMLELSSAELSAMVKAETGIRLAAEADFSRKKKAFDAEVNGRPVDEYYRQNIARSKAVPLPTLSGAAKYPAGEILAGQAVLLPADKIPVIIAGGSFNSESRQTRMTPREKRIIDALLAKGDPAKMYFIIGPSLTGYENYLFEKNAGRFTVIAFTPALITQAEKIRLVRSKLAVFLTNQPASFTLYKAFDDEICQRRGCVLVALDGNYAGVNLLQAAHNAGRNCRIIVNDRCKPLMNKAMALRGYITSFAMVDDPAEEIWRSVLLLYRRRAV